jgi:hypothetical protein
MRKIEFPKHTYVLRVFEENRREDCEREHQVMTAALDQEMESPSWACERRQRGVQRTGVTLPGSSADGSWCGDVDDARRA